MDEAGGDKQENKYKKINLEDEDREQFESEVDHHKSDPLPAKAVTQVQGSPTLIGLSYASQGVPEVKTQLGEPAELPGSIA
ncbi:hypothetical protein L916_01917 [Phytophthora nicotianae]|uniref:Uncharacterized protein n=1 Tax=Phytophthora nicotianae TaxID=4792 RepID=W2JPW6_PHYNI|nr:hypothetical protein L916_01917 [Phytophthora nicotianae]